MTTPRIAPRSLPLLLLLASCSGGGAPDANAPDAPGPDAAAEGGVDARTPDDVGAFDAEAPPDAPDDVAPADASPADASPADAPPADAPPTGDTPFVYVGMANGQIAVYALEMSTGALAPRGAFDAGNYPSFLAVAPSARRLYAVNEAAGSVAAFSIDPATGALALINRVGSGGGGPAYVSLDRAAGHALVANYGGGSVQVNALDPDGALGAVTAQDRPGTNPHAILTDPSGRFVFVPNKGSDYVSQYVYDEAAGTLRPNTPARVATARGAGPRHLAFHPDGRHAYLINELDDTMVALDFDATRGTLAVVQTLPTLPAGADGAANTAADVHVHPSGRFLYGSNRGHDSIVVYAIDTSTGRLTLRGHQRTFGRTPRNFGLDPTGTLLLVANQRSDNVVTFRIDAATGELTRVATTAVAAAPHWVGIVPLPGR